MAQYFQIHPDNPQPRLIRKAVAIIEAGGVVAYPTDSSYAIGCHVGDKAALDRIRRIRRISEGHNFTLVTGDLSEIGTYAKLGNEQYRLLRAHTPGPFTFILPATRLVPRRLQHPRRKTIGVRVPDATIAQALLRELGEPLMSSTLIMPGETVPLSDPVEIRARLEHELALVIDGGYCGVEPTTVIAWVGETPTVTRQGKGDASVFL